MIKIILNLLAVLLVATIVGYVAFLLFFEKAGVHPMIVGAVSGLVFFGIAKITGFLEE